MDNKGKPHAKDTPNLTDRGVAYSRPSGKGSVSNAQGEIGELLATLAGCDSMQKIRPASMWAIRVAVIAAMTDGLAGELTIKLPRKDTHPVEVSFRTELMD